MKATQGVLKAILSGLEQGDNSYFEKYMKRYQKDAELARIYSRFAADHGLAAKMIKSLILSRKMRSTGGTSLRMRDRGELLGQKRRIKKR